jgi:hypothetical protein
VTEPGTSVAAPCFRTEKVAAETEPAESGSENTAVGLTSGATPVAPAAGETLATVGGVVSPPAQTTRASAQSAWS